ncbi:Phosphatidylinositol 4-kinase pik1alpha (PI4-kinase)(PtdIns-4-kinase) [Massospora cicadina]|nr:Phosphatidylinositol 4-kinase pik1alpha (PI4-kinase)(PtdIns-4-kinase) [Massospora cicadina]
MRRSSAIAVELLILGLSQGSTHFAIQTYWYFQAYYADIADSPLHPSSRICRRILRKCQLLLLQDQALTSRHPCQLTQDHAAITRVRENPGSPPPFSPNPRAHGHCGGVKAGRASGPRSYSPVDHPNRRPSSAQLSASPNPLPSRRKSAEVGEPTRDFYLPVEATTDPPSPDALDDSILVDLTSPSLEELRKGQAFTFFQHLDMTQQSGDLSELTAEDLEEGAADSDSSEVFQPHRSLSKGHFFHSEIQFVLTLMSISNRLCLIPKASRHILLLLFHGFSLQAELALLNHNLPADICIPMWCEATPENPSHHKLVRISPKDAVVLNSADRVPYLIFIEVLVDEKGTAVEQAEEQKLPVSIPSTYVLPDAFSDEAVSPSAQNQRYFQSVMSRRTSTTCDEYAESMRTAAVMLAQLTIDRGAVTSTTAKANNHRGGAKETIRERIITEMAALEESRVAKMKRRGLEPALQGSGGEDQGGERVNEQELLRAVTYKEDPSAAVFREDWEAKQKRIREASPFGDRQSWRLLPLIVKTGADLRQEQFALQLIREMERIWMEADVRVWVQRFNIMVTSNDSGLVEMVRNTISVHSLKKDAYTRGINTKGVMYSLYDHFVREFGDPSSERFLVAQDNFLRSLAGYSIISYLLQLKDRHNGNILVDTEGHLVHIDFGFMLSNSPGSVGFEMAPFKMTQEYLDILGGVNSTKFHEFQALMKQGFLAVRKYAENLLLLVEIMQKDSKLPCFSGGGSSSISSLKERFHLGMTVSQVEELVDKLIMSSSCNVFTRLYDTFQYYSNGILRPTSKRKRVNKHAYPTIWTSNHYLLSINLDTFSTTALASTEPND